MAKHIVQLLIIGGQAVGRAFRQALKQEYQATAAAQRTAEEAGRSGTQAAKASNITGMSLNEAKQILNVQDLEDISAIKKNYEHLFKANIKESGGSFYLQSKIFRAGERLELELDEPIVGASAQSDQSKTDKDNSNT